MNGPRPSEPLQWRAATILREGLRNARSTPARTALVAALVATLAAAATLADAAEIHALRSQERAEYLRGSHLVLVSSGSRVDAQRCDGLASNDVVVAASALSRADGETRIRNFGTGLTATTATPGVLPILATLQPDLPVDPTAVALVDAEAAEATGARQGAALELDQQLITVDHVTDLTPLTDRYGSGLVTLTPPRGRADVCLLLAEPGHLQDVSLLLAPNVAVTATTDLRVQTVTDATTPEQLAQQLATRMTRHAAPAVPALLGLLWTLALLGRRREAGLYRSLGLSHAALTCMRTVEFTTAAATGTALAACAAAAGATAGVADADLMLWSLVRTVGILAAGTLIATPFASLLASRGSSLQLVKE